MNTRQDRQDRQEGEEPQQARRMTALSLRLPTALATRLRRLARRHDRSLNGEIVQALRVYVSASERSNDDGTDDE